MRQQGIPQVSKVTTTPAPVRGLNAYDSIVAMPKGFAIVLRNLFAQPYGCQVRKGYRKHCTEGILGAVQSLASHNTNPSQDLYAFADDAGGVCTMYDVTEPNAVAVEKLTGLTNAKFASINFSNAAGTHLVAVNGADPMIWVQPNKNIVQVVSGDGSGSTISGIDPAKFIGLYSHQKRIWFVEDNSSRGWYLPPDQITGVAQAFDFGPLWTRGGNLSQLITWTIDDGDGADDHLMAISSQGQVSVYKGTDPDGADTWSLQGVYFAGAPVGRRAAIRYGGDVLLVSEFGIVMMSNLLKSTKVNPADDSFAKYIQQILSNAVSEFRDEFGWQPFLFPAANMLMINIPATTTTSYQLSMNDITKAWSEFIGYNAYCWALHQQLPFFGSFNGVYRAWEGTTDDETLHGDGTITRGADVRFEAQTTFDYFDSLGQQKHYKMARPTILSRGAFNISFSINVDFVFDSPTAPAAFSVVKPGTWDEDLWDAVVWEGGLMTYKSWQSVTGIGTAAGIRLLGMSASETYWASTDWLYEVGGIM